MPTHVALLCGINVGGRNRIAMTDLRRIAEHLGVRPTVVVLTRAELAEVVADNPSPASPGCQAGLAKAAGRAWPWCAGPDETGRLIIP
jgi:uncharacterized protein (DUF1697 family)